MIARLPEPPAPAPDTTTTGYGLQLIAWLLDTGCDVTLTDDQLRLAEHTVSHAVRLSYPDVRVYDRLADLQRRLGATIRRRQLLDMAPAPAPGGTAPDRPDVGPMAPLRDRPIARPPSGDYADELHQYDRLDVGF